MKRSEFKRRLSAVMRGSDLKFEVEGKEEISCNLCMSIAFQPVVCNKCDNIFCEECFDTFIGEVKVCPLGCEEPNYSKAPESIIKKVRNCVFICPNKTNGCTRDVGYDEVFHHELTCPFKLIKCSGFKLCKMTCLRSDLYLHETVCPYSLINQKNFENLKIPGLDSLDSSGCRGCAICQNGSGCFDQLKRKISGNFSEFAEIINNLAALVRSQDDQIKELRARLEKLEDEKEKECVDLQKLHHNVNTSIDVDKLISAQEPESKGWFGAQHYDTVKASLEPLKEFYEHKDWTVLSNLGVTQVYTKQAESETEIHILARSEINHMIQDISEEIDKQQVFMTEDPNLALNEIVQKVGDGINVHYLQFSKFLVAANADCVCLCQKVQYEDDNGVPTVVYPLISVNHYKKKAKDEFERLNMNIGGWVLKSLGTHKTLVNIFFSVNFPKTAIPEILLSKHAKTLIAMLRVLESHCTKNYKRDRLGSKIFEKTQNIVLDEQDVSRPVLQEQDEEEEEKFAPDDSRKQLNGQEKVQKDVKWTIVDHPTDIPEIDPSTVSGPYKEFILGTRARLTRLIDMINTGNWKKVSTKKECDIYVKKAESGLTCVKGETYFPFDAEKIIEFIKRADIRPDYDKYTESAHIIDEVDHRTLICYAKIKKILVVSSRDITFASQLITSKATGTMYTPTYSVELPDYPAQKDPVRAEVAIGGWVISKAKDGGSHCIYASELDLKGNIPKFMIEKTADIQVAVVTSLRDYMMKTLGVQKGEVWVRPESEKLPETEEVKTTNDQVKESATQLAKVAETKAEEIKEKAEEVKEKIEEEKVTLSNGTPGAPGKLNREEEINKYQVNPSDVVFAKNLPEEDKKGPKKGHINDFGIDTSFMELTEAQCVDQFNPEDLNEGKETILEARKATFDLMNEIHGDYNKLKTQKKIQIFTRDNAVGGQSVLGVGEIPFNIDKIAEVLCDDTQRKGFDDMLDDAEILNEYPHLTFCIYIMFKRILILSPRDFVCVGAFVKFKDGTYVFPTYSVEREEKPETKQFIRAQLFIGGWVLKPIDQDNTLVYYYNRADMKGSLPAWVMKQGASMQALLIAKLRDYMIKKNK